MTMRQLVPESSSIPLTIHHDMNARFHCYRPAPSLFREMRLLRFGRFESGNRTEDVKNARDTIGGERKQRKERAGDISDRLNARRLGTPLVEQNHSQELLEAERETVLLGDMPDTPRYRGLQQKVVKLEQMCASRGTIEGITFGFNGQQFTLISADEDFVQKALLHVAEEMAELRRPDDRPELRLPQHPGESDEDYAQRIRSVDTSGAVAKKLRGNRKKEDADQWQLLYAALRKYKSAFEGFKQILSTLENNPQAINTVPDSWKKENPASYTKALKEAAKKDASVLAGKEKDFGAAAFVLIIQETLDEQPTALRYYPESLKKTKSGRDDYRNLLVTHAARNGDLLSVTAPEYDRIWKEKPDQYTALVKASLKQNPALILEPSLWQKGEHPAILRDLLDSFDYTAKIKVLRNITRKNADALGVHFPVSFAKEVYGMEKNRTILTIVQNEDCLSIIQERDRAFFDTIVGEFFTLLTEDEQRQASTLPHYEKMRAYALHTLHIELGVALLGEQDPHRMVRNLNADLALREWTAVKEEWVKKVITESLTPQQAAQWRAMITRNLSFNRQAVTRENVMSECTRILEQRKKYRGVSLFAGREVLHVAHSELRDKKNKTHRFGSDALQNAIRFQSGNDHYQFIRPEATRESLKEAKDAILKNIVSAGHPFTFVFEGHGSPEAIYLSDGEVIDEKRVRETPDTIRITVAELATALRLRSEWFPAVGDPADPRRRDILVLESCFNADFLRALHTRLGDAPKPIVLGASEYGQYSYDQKSDTLGSHFFSGVLQMGKKNHISTFGDVFEHEFEGPTNPSIYGPDEKNTTQQVTEIDREKDKGYVA